MRRSPSIVPETDNSDIYLVLDDFGVLGRVWRETNEERTDRETVITDLIEGQYSHPARVIAFNTSEGWSRDVSEELAEIVTRRFAGEDRNIPQSLESFVDRHGGARPAQLPLPLKGAV